MIKRGSLDGAMHKYIAMHHKKIYKGFVENRKCGAGLRPAVHDQADASVRQSNRPFGDEEADDEQYL